jgi:hypothetical protein
MGANAAPIKKKILSFYMHPRNSKDMISPTLDILTYGLFVIFSKRKCHLYIYFFLSIVCFCRR